VVHIEVMTEGGSKCYETKNKRGHKIFSRWYFSFWEHSGNPDI